MPNSEVLAQLSDLLNELVDLLGRVREEADLSDEAATAVDALEEAAMKALAAVGQDVRNSKPSPEDLMSEEGPTPFKPIIRLPLGGGGRGMPIRRLPLGGPGGEEL